MKKLTSISGMGDVRRFHLSLKRIILCVNSRYRERSVRGFLFDIFLCRLAYIWPPRVNVIFNWHSLTSPLPLLPPPQFTFLFSHKMAACFVNYGSSCFFLQNVRRPWLRGKSSQTIWLAMHFLCCQTNDYRVDVHVAGPGKHQGTDRGWTHLPNNFTVFSKFSLQNTLFLT